MSDHPDDATGKEPDEEPGSRLKGKPGNGSRRGPKDATGQPPPGRARVEEIDERLGQMRDAVTGSLRDIADQFQAAFGSHVRTSGFGIRHEIRSGPILDEEGRVIATPPPATEEPGHDLRQDREGWSLDCRLPGCGPLDLVLDSGPGWLVLRARDYRLETPLPADLDRQALVLRFEDGVLHLSGPRGAAPK